MIRDLINDLPPERRRTKKQIFLNFLFNQRFRLLVNHRIGSRLHKSNNRFLVLISRFLKNKQWYKWGCNIQYDAVIGKRVVFKTPTGVVVAKGAVIGNDVKIWANVVLGSHGRPGSPLKYPTVKNGARIYAGAVIIGGVTIGENAIVGANSVVNVDVPDNCIAVGVPCKIIKQKKVGPS